MVLTIPIYSGMIAMHHESINRGSCLNYFDSRYSSPCPSFGMNFNSINIDDAALLAKIQSRIISKKRGGIRPVTSKENIVQPQVRRILNEDSGTC